MRQIGGIALIILAIAVLIVGSASFFTVQQTEQALVLRFGEPVAGRGLVSTPGLHYKVPFIEDVVYLDNRILDIETPDQEVLASDNTRVQVDAFMRYKILDPLRFYQTVGTLDRGNNQLGFVLNSAIRRVLGEADLTQIVSSDRGALMEKIRDQVNNESGRLGVRAVDVRIRRADLPKQISEQVFNRMITERAREASEYRAKGSEQAQKIRAKADRDIVVLLGEAQQQADQARGQGDAMRNQIFADAYTKDPDFFAFYRSMIAYDTALKGPDTRMVISPVSDFFRYFKSPAGKAPASAPAAEKPLT
ncbi:protease modulator HflC [Beijerinckia sp. L45]|uniref:protease modulator HflC n=1 Tax=Beijerinckia sp. L45 TaxID=1641855 RepID=UPI00131E376A|nr:protease modulator HflC [Beijerinckia sp. L45]